MSADEQYRELQRNRHLMRMAGLSPFSPAIEAVEDRMETLWDSLSAESQMNMRCEAILDNAIERDAGR